MEKPVKLWSDEAADITVTLSYEPTPAAIDLLMRTVWGNSGLRYQIRDIETKLLRLVQPYYLTLKLKRDLAAVCVLNRRPSRLLDAPLDSFHLVMLATDPAMTHQGLAGLLVEQAIKLCQERLADPGVAYAYIEAGADYSFRISKYFGPPFAAALPLTVFSRLRPFDDTRVGPLGPVEAEEVQTRLSALYKGHLFSDFDTSLMPGEYQVFRDGGQIVAGVQVEMLNWSIHSIPGLFGWLTLKFLQSVPSSWGLPNPADLHFVRFSNLLVEPGAEVHFVCLLEALLARYRVPLGVMILDERSHVFSRVQGQVKSGLIARAVAGKVQVLAGFKGLHGTALTTICSKPMLMSPLDVF